MSTCYEEDSYQIQFIAAGLSRAILHEPVTGNRIEDKSGYNCYQ
jgi:hypothetical protein